MLRSDEVDYECELAVVIGRDAKNVSREDALSYVAGYTCANDVSARDHQIRLGGGQWCRGKFFDTFAPFGPCLVTPDEIPNPNALKIATILNGDRVQDWSTDDMIFDVPAIIAYLSGSTTLPAPAPSFSPGRPTASAWRRNPSPAGCAREAKSSSRLRASAPSPTPSPRSPPRNRGVTTSHFTVGSVAKHPAFIYVPASPPVSFRQPYLCPMPPPDRPDSGRVVPPAYVLPFILVTVLFSLWGFANDVTNPLVRVFKEVFVISNAQSSMVQWAFYGGYATMTIPAALVVIRRFSYKTGILVGLRFTPGAPCSPFLPVPS